MVKQAKSWHVRLNLEALLRRPTHSARDRPPFEQIWQPRRQRVWALVARLASNKDIADDLTQEVAVQALRGYDAFRGDSDPMTWLFRIAIHTVLRHREKSTTANNSCVSLTELEEGDSPHLHASASEQPENRLLTAEGTPGIRRALDALPDELRTPLILHVYEEMKCREIADTLAIPLGTVLSRLHTARQRMRVALEKEIDREN